MAVSKLNGKTFDIVEENISKLKELFPEIVNGDNQVDLEVLQDLFEKNDDEVVDDGEEHYKFTWWGKKEAKKIAKEKITKTLRPSKEYSKNWDDTKNIYIEGDNLEALKILLGSYRNRIKMIYIDPPYNTSSDFIYHDKFDESDRKYLESTNQLTEEGYLKKNADTDGKYHSNWLNMMYPRLYVAKKLLTNDGLIFISIDDNEFTNLKKILDEIFGEKNFVSVLKWKKKKQPSFLSKVAGIMEYIVVYANNYASVPKLYGEILSDEDKPIINTSNNVSERYFNSGILVRSKNNGTIPKGIYKNRSMTIEFLDDIIVKDGVTLNKFRAKAKFRSTQENINEFISQNLIFITINNGLRRFLTDDEKSKRKSITDLILDWGQNQDGSNELKKLFNINDDENIFDNPKPVDLIKNLINTNVYDDSIVLDFFSGSSTSAHSVMEFNSENEGNIKFIMVQIPEEVGKDSKAYKEGYENICEIGKERIRRAGDKIVEESGNNELDIGFKVFKVDESNFIPWNSNLNRENIKQAILSTGNNLVEGRKEIDLIYELLLKLNLDLNSSIDEVTLDNDNKNKIYVIENGFMFICLDSNINQSLASDLLDLKKELKSDYCQVVLLDSALNDEVSININETLSSEGVSFYTI